MNYIFIYRTAFQSPPWQLVLFIGIPILVLVNAITLVPWYFILKCMVYSAKSGGWYVTRIDSVWHAFQWWITPNRLFYYFLLRIIRRCVVPFIRILVTIIIKWTIIGKFTPMNAYQKQRPWNIFRYWLMSRLEPGGNLGGLSRLIGSHYEYISVVYRLLGAKIGKRVYWPGSGLEIVEYDLLEVGDDVVFGSRSVVMTSSAVRSAKVVFESGTMVTTTIIQLMNINIFYIPFVDARLLIDV